MAPPLFRAKTNHICHQKPKSVSSDSPFNTYIQIFVFGRKAESDLHLRHQVVELSHWPVHFSYTVILSPDWLEGLAGGPGRKVRPTVRGADS
jgi:hypothetical protein